MLARVPQYNAVLNQTSIEVASRVAEAKATASAASAKEAAAAKKLKPVSLLSKLSKEIREELFSKQLRLNASKRNSPKKLQTH